MKSSIAVMLFFVASAASAKTVAVSEVVRYAGEISTSLNALNPTYRLGRLFSGTCSVGPTAGSAECELVYETSGGNNATVKTKTSYLDAILGEDTTVIEISK
jgi:hypothetical protein